MKIMVPISSPDDIELYRNAGADEFYFGFQSEAWDGHFGMFEECNRMSSFGSKANIPYERIQETADRIQSCGGNAFLAVNSPCYSEAELRFLRHLSDDWMRLPLNGIIVGDLALCRILLDKNLPVTLSTMMGVYNSLILDFYYRLGVKSVILPRDLQWNDLMSILFKFPDVRFECFILRNGCRYSDSNCLSFHSRKFGAVCGYLNRIPCKIYYAGSPSVAEHRESYGNHTLYTRAFHQTACGLCAVKKLRNAGVSSLKIVGRADKKQELLRDITVLRRLLDSNSEEDEMETEACLYGLNCYYHIAPPDV